MKFSAQEDIEAPIDRVFAHVSNFEAFERNAIRRGAEIERESASMQPTLGMAWKVRFEFRGRARKVKVKLSELAAGKKAILFVRGITHYSDQCGICVKIHRSLLQEIQGTAREIRAEGLRHLGFPLQPVRRAGAWLRGRNRGLCAREVRMRVPSVRQDRDQG